MTFIPKAIARRATSPPMRPMPTMPSVLPLSSVPSNDFRSHLPAAIEACACGILRAEREQQREGVLRGGDRVAARRVHDHDAALGRGGDVDVVHAHARAADHLQPLRRGERLRGHLRLAAHDERVELGDLRDQLVLLQTAAGRDFKLRVFRENGDALGRNAIGGENAISGHPGSLEDG